jgi:hypothetical protein
MRETIIIGREDEINVKEEEKGIHWGKTER